MSFEQFFYPESVAVVGSMTPGKLGAELVSQILVGGYQGHMYAINPKAEGTLSAQGFESIVAIGRPVDLAIIAAPAKSVAAVMEDCGKAGVHAAVIITSGFSEVGNRAGEEEIKQIARQYNILFNGPNSAGIVNTAHHFCPTLELRPPAGKVAFISQSGAVGGMVLAWAEQKGLGISKFVSYGNAAGINESDLLRYLSHDPETSVVALYIESVKDGRAFIAALDECSRQKPVLVVKAGRTQAGLRATASHTGSMAGADRVYETAIRQGGAVRVRSVEQMLDLCEGFLNLPPVLGRNILIVTNSGGPGVLAADLAEEIGLVVPEPALEIQTHLKAFLPGHCSLKNPIDLTVEGNQEGFEKTLETALMQGNYDAALAINIATPYLDSLALAQGIVNAQQHSGKPVTTCFLPDQLVEKGVAFLKQQGVPNFASGERAAAVLADMASYYMHRERLLGKPGLLPTAQSKALQPLPGSGAILEPDAMAWLKDNGISTPPFRMAHSADEAVVLAQELGFPVVMKVVSPDIIHKSDYGGVKVNLRSDDDVRRAFADIQRAAHGKDLRGAILYPMVTGAQEVLVGMSNDPQFGPVLAFGLGGIYTEVWKDIALRVAPVGLDDAQEMINEIKSINLLKGVRGQAPCDLDALADLLVKFSELPFKYEGIGEIDLNPVFLLPQGLMVGDVRVIRSVSA